MRTAYFLLPALLLIATEAAAVGVCFEDSPNGINGSWNCADPPELVPNSYVGYSIDETPCEVWVFPGGRRGPVPPYIWSVSASTTDPSHHTGPLPVGNPSLWLWLYTDAFWSDPGATASEFTLAADDSSLQLLSVTTYNGIMNQSAIPKDFELIMPWCVEGPILVAELTMQYLGPTPVEGESWGQVKALYR